MTRSEMMSAANKARNAGRDSALQNRWAEACDRYTEAAAQYAHAEAGELAAQAREEAAQCRRNARNLLMFSTVRQRLATVEGVLV